jgi:hypothetical protein
LVRWPIIWAAPQLGDFSITHDSENDKRSAHELIDLLHPAQLAAAIGLLQDMLDPVSLAIANAPFDDEELRPEMEKRLAEAPSGSSITRAFHTSRFWPNSESPRRR